MAQLDLDRVFTYHPPFGNQTDRYLLIRDAARQFAEVVRQCCPPSREQSLAYTDIQRAVMMANAAIANTEVQPPVDIPANVVNPPTTDVQAATDAVSTLTTITTTATTVATPATPAPAPVV